MIVIYDTLGVYGGSLTLMLRMGEWLNSHNEKMTIICTKASNTEIIGKLEQYNVQIIEANLADARIGYKVIKKLIDIEPMKIFCFAWNYYLDIERIKKKYNLSFDNFVYCIHPNTFKKGIGFKTDFMREYLIKSYSKIFKCMKENNALISMDEVNIEESENFFSSDDCANYDNIHSATTITKTVPETNTATTVTTTIPIIRLPMICHEMSDAEEIIEHGFKSNVLLTAARAEFPYKGYMIGLVDIFANLKDSYPEMRLEYITSGDDTQELKDKINTQDENIRSSIILHGWMEYEDLKAKIRDCRAFIGMGTSVFDAALQYKPSIVVKFNTMECVSDHFVAEKPEYVTVMSPDCHESAEGRIKQAFDWDFTEYREQCFLSFTKTKEVYDIDVCMRKMINMENKQKSSILSNYECARHHLNLLYNKIRFRNKKSFSDFKNIEWDKGLVSKI